MAEQVDLSNFYPFLLHVKKFFEDDVNNRYREEAQEMASHLKNLYSAICSKYGFDNELLDAGQIGTPSAMEYEQEMPCQQQRENVSHHVLQPLQQNVSPLQHNMSPLHHDTSPPLQSAKVPNRQYSLSALMENKEEQRVEEQEVERQEEEPIHVPPVINYDKAYNKRIELEVESVKGNNKVVARTCGVAYNGNDEEKKFSDDMKNIIKSHCAALRTNKDLFRYMSYVTTHRLKCGYCMECKNDFKLVDI